MVALQPLADSEPWIFVRNNVTMRFAELNETALTGIFPVIVTEMFMPSTEQPLRVSDVTVPIPVPDSPVPVLKEPFAVDEVQVTDWPAVESVTMVVPALAVVAPPGLTVHVAAVAKAGAAAMPMTAAVAALVISAFPKRLRIALTPFPCRLSPPVRRRSGYASHAAHRRALSTVATHTGDKVTRWVARGHPPGTAGNDVRLRFPWRQPGSAGHGRRCPGRGPRRPGPSAACSSRSSPVPR